MQKFKTGGAPSTRRSLIGMGVVVVIGTVLAGSAHPAAQRIGAHPAPTRIEAQDVLPSEPASTGPPPDVVAVPAPLVPPDMDLRAPPVPVPLRVIVASLKIDIPVLGTGLSGPNNTVDAPKGPPDDPVWREGFWYRGSGIPGDSGVASIAGHVDDSLGRVSPFFQLRNLKPGDDITVKDTRSGGPDVHFKVTDTKQFTEKESSQPENLARIYGSGPANGRGPQPSPDGQSYLTLLTCAGDFVNGSFDHRMVVFAVRYLPT